MHCKNIEGGNSMFINSALSLVYSYFRDTMDKKELALVSAELRGIAEVDDIIYDGTGSQKHGYADVQGMLSKLNEKESIRKSKGVYYTPADVVRFILVNSIKASYGKLDSGNIGSEDLGHIPYRAFAQKKTVFDPTCGAGEYLLTVLEFKFELWDSHNRTVSRGSIAKIVKTIYGNDVNRDSVIITRLRLFLSAAHRYGIRKCVGLSQILKDNFSVYDYILKDPEEQKKYDIIVGNPPYVEDFRSNLSLDAKYGNIYANVLIHAAKQLTKNGSIGFIIPLSYVSTPRMNRLRAELFMLVKEQYILSYADRPDCLFDSVHQKLCILIGKKKQGRKTAYTSNYQFWYEEERESLFARAEVVRNPFYFDNFIPKLGTDVDVAIFKKIKSSSRTRSVYDNSRIGQESVYLNRRETFWMKAYRREVDDPEYKVFRFASEDEANYCYCLINSSLFWWYWICVSDCWHVSKELNGFMAPFDGGCERATPLAEALIRKLEETKVYVGTKQTEYEYKHRECIDEIHAIDDYVNEIFGLTAEESSYVKDFAFRYRTSGGAGTNEGD